MPKGMTQFGRTLAELNIEIIWANSSQAKGRLERVNRTLQDRLVKELRLDDVCDMELATSSCWAYVDDFRYLPLLCAVCVPLTSSLKKPGTKGAGYLRFISRVWWYDLKPPTVFKRMALASRAGFCVGKAITFSPGSRNSRFSGLLNAG
jgi:hypothetical protein